MRKLMISFLLVSTAAMPALAQDRDGSRRDRGGQSAQSDDNDRAARRAARAERAEAKRTERPQRAEAKRTERAERPQRAERPERVRDQRVDAAEAPRRVRVARPADNGVRRVETRRPRGDNDSLAQQLLDRRNAQRDGTVEVRRHRDGDREYRVRDGVRYEVRNYGDNDRRRWSGDWRSDRRYDWRRHRDRNRSIFHFGSYYDPYRYGYRRFSIGFNLWPSYYSSRYWLQDPGQYRLPPAYGPYRWVRYYDDALLVNIYTGQVVDVIHSFFW